jgi:GNAT superfamily N-acetyltransferase
MAVLERLDTGHVVDTFASGVTALDDWLKRHSRLAMRKGLCAVYVLHENGNVIGYFALAPHVIGKDDVPRRLGGGDPWSIPAILVAKLAVDQRHQGKGIGQALLVEALRRAVSAAAIAGGRYVVVDAIDAEAAAFYAHFDFRASPGDPLRLMRKVSEVAAALDRLGQ